MSLYLISDIHLDATRPAIVSGFLKLLRERPVRTDSLYILGDLFEVWLGDDHRTPFNRSIIDGLAEMTGRGVHLYIMHGNRDFLLGPAFCAQTGAQLLPDPALIKWCDRPVLLTHGDCLCTDDTEYMKVRAGLRDEPFQRDFLSRSLEERATIATGARVRSRNHTASTEAYIMDVNADAVGAIMRRHQSDFLVHGHTHRPMVHRLQVDQTPATRVVLGDWSDKGWMLELREDGYALESFAIDSGHPTA